MPVFDTIVGILHKSEDRVRRIRGNDIGWSLVCFDTEEGCKSSVVDEVEVDQVKLVVDHVVLSQGTIYLSLVLLNGWHESVRVSVRCHSLFAR